MSWNQGTGWPWHALSGQPQNLLPPAWLLREQEQEQEQELGCLQIRAACFETFKPKVRVENLGNSCEEGQPGLCLEAPS